MPLILHEKRDKFSFAVWLVSEDLSFFLDKIPLFSSEQKEIEKLKSHRLLEWISARYLLSILENKDSRSCCLKDKYGKPYLEKSDSYISLSHSGNLVAAVISESLVGIDIQKINDKVERIKHKFLSNKEMLDCDDGLICFNRIWTAKEAVYKAYGKKSLKFIENIKIDKFTLNKDFQKSIGVINKDEINIDFELLSKDFDDSILTIALIK